MKSFTTPALLLAFTFCAVLPSRLSSQPAADPFRPATSSNSGQGGINPATGLPRNKSNSNQDAIDPATGLPANNFDATSGPAGMSPRNQNTFGGGSGGFGGFGGAFGARTGPGQGGEVSLVFFEQPSPKTCDEIAEDMQALAWLLSRNLERGFAQDSTDYKLGIPMLLAGNGRSVESSYIEGFGVVFKLPVRFPLLAPAGEESSSPGTAATSEWEEAKRALSGSDSSYGRPAGIWQGTRFPGSEPYDAKLVQALKQRILQTLKNASNLRHLQPDKWIVVTVLGAPNPAAGPRKSNRAGAAGEGALEGSVSLAVDPATGLLLPAGGSDPARTTLMTLRVRMSNVMAYAADKLSDEQFAKEAEVATYSGAVSSYGRFSGASNAPAAARRK